jgi:hypothetical protein
MGEENVKKRRKQQKLNKEREIPDFHIWHFPSHRKDLKTNLRQHGQIQR